MLFVVMLGGKHPRARIEVHDVVFVVAETLQATYPQLRDAWFGSPKGVHIDSWMAVDGVDGWKIQLSHLAPAAGAQRLYFINIHHGIGMGQGPLAQHLLFAQGFRFPCIARNHQHIVMAFAKHAGFITAQVDEVQALGAGSRRQVAELDLPAVDAIHRHP